MKTVKLDDISEIISGLLYGRLDENGEKFKLIVQMSIKNGKLSDFKEISIEKEKLVIKIEN